MNTERYNAQEIMQINIASLYRMYLCIKCPTELHECYVIQYDMDTPYMY